MLRFWTTTLPGLNCDDSQTEIRPTFSTNEEVNLETAMPFDAKREWKFRVEVETAIGESVGLVGNCNELGNWMNSKSVQLTKEPESLHGSNIWSVTCDIPANKDVEFRYYVCIVIEPSVDVRLQVQQVIVRRSETNITPRIIRKEATSRVNKEFDVHTFGCYDAFTKVDRGWLTTETIIQLKLCNNPIVLWSKKYRSKKINVKVTPVILSRRVSSITDALPSFDMGDVHEYDENVDTLDTTEQPINNWPLTEISVLDDEEYEYTDQPQFGRAYKENDFLTFKVNLLFPESVAYLIDYYIYGSRTFEEDPPYHCGFSYILPSILKSSSGQAIVPITSVKHRPIGQITVEYLVIKPIQGFECDMSISYSRVWMPTWLGLDVGHRGAGNSFKECAIQGHSNTIRENTIASLKKAASFGADFVEFDIQLSKDLVPVLYHDFHVCMAIKRKNHLSDSDMFELPLKDLTLEQLQRLKIYHVTEGKDNNPRFFDEELEDHQPFPTLEHAFLALNPHVGFNIEIKWTMELKDGTFELNHPFDLNMYLDTILKVVLQHGGSRKIIFSCFHPDICTMIRLKQNKYPVIFLTQGTTMKYPSYNDPRTQTIAIGVSFALSEGILGLNVHAEDILRDPTQVKLVLDAGLVLFSWGDDNNDPATIKYLKQLGLHAVIYDKIDEFSSKEVKESIFLVESRESALLLKKFDESLQSQEMLPPPPPSYSVSEYVLDVEKALEATRPNVSTSSSLATIIHYSGELGDKETDNPPYLEGESSRTNV